VAYRVVQWATGAMGKAVLRTIIDHPGVELAGVYVYSDAKAGRDAGELAGRPPTGVLATSDVEEILALDADVVVHAGRIGPYGSHDEELARILAAGKNVITINGYSHPAYWPAARTERLRAACAAGGSTLLGAGLNPGFIAEQIATVATGVCASVDHIQITEAADASEVRDPAYLFGTLGFGVDPAACDPNDPSWGPSPAASASPWTGSRPITCCTPPPPTSTCPRASSGRAPSATPTGAGTRSRAAGGG
jgi:hypothetical protein